MAITVLSPHSGNPVTVRDQDVGKSVKDREGRTFYVLQAPDGLYYAALTKVGGQKDLDRYLRTAERQGFVGGADDKGPKKDEVYRHHPVPHHDGFPWGKWIKRLVILGLLAGGAYYAHTKGWVRIPGLAAPAPAR